MGGNILATTGANTLEEFAPLLSDKDLLVHLSTNQFPWASPNGHIFQPKVIPSEGAYSIIFEDITSARMDALLGIPNRAALEERIGDLDSNSRHAVTVFFVDLDDFKPINDTLGHAAGDELLIATSRLVENALKRSGDTLYRYGGDELVGIAPEMSAEGAKDFFTRLETERASVNEKRQQSNLPIIKFSIRSAHREALSPESLRSTLEKADLEMYVSKRQKKLAHQYHNDGSGI